MNEKHNNLIVLGDVVDLSKLHPHTTTFTLRDAFSGKVDDEQKLSFDLVIAYSQRQVIDLNSIPEDVYTIPIINEGSEDDKDRLIIARGLNDGISRFFARVGDLIPKLYSVNGRNITSQDYRILNWDGKTDLDGLRNSLQDPEGPENPDVKRIETYLDALRCFS